ncbi:MAG: hypothetical protein K1Y36_13540 [Blastocatellia bacterium]|nr:hypothetical protein [Blastocatellia bacterium]
MKLRLLSFVLFAATVFAVGSSVPTYAEGPRVIRTPDSQVVLVLNDGKPEHVRLQDLTEGASKTISSGNHTIVVTRRGNTLAVSLDGKELSDADLLPKGKDGKPVMVFMSADGPGGNVEIRDSQVIMLKDDQNNMLKVVADSQKKEVTVTQGGASQTIRLTDLAEGETRTFAAGQHNVTVTRQGDKLVLKVDGKEMGHPVMLRSEGGDKMFHVFVDQDGKPGDVKERHIVVAPKGEAGQHQVIVTEEVNRTSENGNAPKESNIRVMFQSKDGQMNVNADGQVYTFKVEGLNDGESRTFQAGTHTVVVTKTGDRFSVSVDGK